MTEAGKHCFICQTTEGPFEGNHVAGRPNAPNAVVTLCKPCHDAFTALQRSMGIAKPGRKQLDYPPMSPLGKVVALAQGGVAHLILAARRHPQFDPEWEARLDRFSFEVTDLAATIARETGERVPLPDPLADDADPA